MPAPITGDLADMFGDEIIVERWLQDDNYGESQYDTANPQTIPARIIGRTRMAIDADGNEQVSNVQAMLPGEYNVSTKDRFTVPLRFSSAPFDPTNLVARQPRALAVDRSSDENGPHHEVVYFTITRSRGF